MKAIFIIITVFLLLGGIIGTSINVFDFQNKSKFISSTLENEIYLMEKKSIRQIDSLSAVSNFRFTIKNSLRN